MEQTPQQAVANLMEHIAANLGSRQKISGPETSTAENGRVRVIYHLQNGETEDELTFLVWDGKLSLVDASYPNPNGLPSEALIDAKQRVSDFFR